MFYMFLADGFEETEAIAALDVLRRGKLDVKTVGVTGEYATSSHGVTVKADLALSEVDLENIQGAILPGGMPGTLNLENSEDVIACVKHCYTSGKIVAAICAAPSILGHLGMLENRKATCFPGFETELKGAQVTSSPVETDGNVVTAKGAGCAILFGKAILSLASSQAEADRVCGEMQCP